MLRNLPSKYLITSFFRVLVPFLMFIAVGPFGADAQTASFTASKTKACSPANIDFTDTSTDASSWEWDFGNSNTSTVQNPSANYPDPGTYTVTLTINGGIKSTQTIYVYPPPNPIITEVKKDCELFSTTLSVDASPVVVSPFNIGSSSVGGITGGVATTYTWNFLGALPTVVENDPTLDLTDIPAGIYDVLLTVEDIHGCSKTVFVQDVITVNAKPTADFSFVKANLCGTGEVTFSGTADISFGIINGYAWDIGNDGSIESSVQEYTHDFTTAGTYDVAFYVTSADGCPSEKIVKQVIFNSDNQVDFFFAGTCVGQPVDFTDKSSAGVASWAWDFDDDGTVDDTTQNPSHTYSSTGDKKAKLTVTFTDGCVMEKSYTVSINGATSSFTYDTSNSCAEDYTISFLSTSTTSGAAITGYAWDFDNKGTIDDNTANPSHSFSAPGNPPVTLTVTTADGCSNSSTVSLDIPATTIDFSIDIAEGCVPLNSTFTPIYTNDSDPIVKYTWNFGDPASGAEDSSLVPSPSHNYTDAGEYTIILIVETTNGCTLTSQKVIKAGAPQEITDVSYTQESLCQTSSVEFTADINALTDKLVWNFNDETGIETEILSGQTTSSKTHSYANPGSNHSVTVTAWYNGCKSAAVFTRDGIIINEPIASFTVVKKHCKVPTDAIVFNNTSISTDGVTNYLWDFGDGDTSVETNPSHIYTKAGDFKVILTVENTATSCTAKAEKTIHVTDAVTMFSVVNNVGTCAATPLDFINESTLFGNFEEESYLWTFGDGKTSTVPNPSHVYSNPGLYDVTVKVTEKQGCAYSYKHPQKVDIRGPIVNFTNDPTQICSGTEVSFTNTTTKAGNDPIDLSNNTYYWTFDDGQNSTENDPKHTFTGSGNFTVKLQATDEKGCVSSKSITNSVVVPNLAPSFSTAKEIYCLGDKVNFINTATITNGTATITNYEWDLDGDGTFEISTGSNANQSITFGSVGIYTVSQRITSSLGCFEIFSKDIRVVDGTGKFTYLPSDLGCAPVNLQVEPEDPVDIVSSYLWDFGDGQTSVARNPGHFYTLPGTYRITLTENLTGGCVRTSSQDIVIAGAVGTFSYENTPGCADHTEIYYAKNLSSVSAITWDFGDGATLTETVNPGDTDMTTDHTYTTWGTRLPILILRDATCGDYAYYYGVDQRINTSEDPIAEFSFESFSGETCERLTFQFTDKSTIVDPRYDIASWNWDFGDGNTSNLQNPTHSYAIAGPYTVTLSVTNGFIPGACEASVSHVVVVNPLPVVSTTNLTQEICSGTSSELMKLSSSLPGSSFVWTRNSPAGITTAQVTGGTTDIPVANFTNSTNKPVDVVYTITPTGPNPTNCEGDPILATLTVNPIPTVSSSLSKTICNNTGVNYTPTSDVSGVTFAWTATHTGGASISGFSATGVGPINNVLLNSGTTTGQVTYEIVPTGPATTTCLGLPSELVVTVNPTPDVIATPAVETICNGGSSNISLSTSVTGPIVTYSWTAAIQSGAASGFSTGSGNSIDQTLINTSTSQATIRYTVTPAIGSCDGTPKFVDVVVNPSGQAIQPNNQVVCNTSLTSDVSFNTTNSDGGTTYSWTNDNINIGMGASGSGTISSFTGTNTTTSPITGIIKVTPHYTNDGVTCDGPVKTFSITVNPTAQVDNPGTQVVCNNGLATVTFTTENTVGTTTYAWTNDNASIGLGVNGNGNLSFMPTNTTSDPISADIRITPTFTHEGVSCSGPAEVFTIIVNPSGELVQPASEVVCNTDLTTAVNFSTNNNGGVTTYSWTNNKPGIGLAASGTGDIAGFATSNTGTSPVVANIVVTPHFENGGTICDGPTKSFTITVNPTPKVSSDASKTICDGSPVNYNIESLTTGTTFRWDRALVAGITEAAVNSQTSDPILETLTNTTNSPIDVTYVITPTGPASTNCPGEVKSVVVTVNPTPDVIATPASETICNGELSNIALSTHIMGATVTYSWTAALQSGTASGFSDDNGSSIVQTLINTSTSTATVRYTITPHIGSCSGVSIDVDVIVNPTGQVNQPDNQTICNTDNTTLVAFGTNNTVGTTTYSWTNTNPAIGLVGSGSGDIPSFIGTNTSTAPITGTILVTPSYSNAGETCNGPGKSFTITVNPTAQVNDPSSQVFCNNESSSVAFGTLNSGGVTTYAWVNDNPAIGLAASGNGDLSFTASNVTTAPILANITVTPTFTNGSVNCSGPDKVFTITVNPSGQVNDPIDQTLCNNANTNVVVFATNNTVGTTDYSWTNDNTSIGLAAIGTKVLSIASFQAINTGIAPDVANIEVTPYYTNEGKTCVGVSEDFLMTVNPTPVVSSASSISICNGNVVNYTPTSLTDDVTYSWTASNTVGTVTGFTASGVGPINDALENSGAADGKVTYIIIPSGPVPTSCSGPAFSLEVTVVNCDPKIGVSKQLVSVNNNGDGTYEALFDIRVRNYGNLDLDNIQVTDDLATVFGASNYSVLELSSTSFDVNTAFNGNSTKDMLNNSGTKNTLAVGASTDIRLRVKILSEGSYSNSVTATSTTGSVSDDSQDGSDPDPDGDENPGNNNVNTPVVINCENATVNASSDVTLCEGSYHINAATASKYASLKWTTSGDGVFSSDVILHPIYTPGAADMSNGSASLTLTVDSYGSCSQSSDQFVLTISDLSATVTTTDPSCSGGTGSVTVNAAGGLITGGIITATEGYHYRLDGGATQVINTFSDVAVGNHTLTVTDDNGCTISREFDIDEPTALTLSLASQTNVLCKEASTGSAIVVASGGTTGYIYSIIDQPAAGTDAIISGNVISSMEAGEYKIRVTDDNLCSSDLIINISEPDNALDIITAAAVLKNPTCNGSADGKIDITVSGGTAPYSYAWSNGSNSEDAEGLDSGTYSVTVTDANGCSIVGGVYTLTDPDAETITVSSIANTTCNASVGSVILTSSDGSTITLNETTQASGSTFSGLRAGYYIATSNGGCQATTSFNIINTNSTLTASVTSHSNVKCNGDADGAATVVASGGTAPFSFSLNGAAGQPTGVFTGLSAGEYGVLITDVNACSYIVSFDIDEPTALTLSLASQTNVLCKGSSTGSVIVVAAGGTPVYNYSILAEPVGGTSAIINGNVITGMEAGTYTIRVSDGNTCFKDLDVIISEPLLALDITTNAVAKTGPTCNGSSDKNIDITVSGGTAPYIYAWSNGFNGEDPTGLAAGTYTVIVSDGNGCTATETYILTEPAALVLNTSGIVNTECNASVGSITLEEASGTAGTFTVAGLSKTGTSASFTDLEAGFYTAIFTATSGGCTAETTFNIINENSTLTASVTSHADVSCSGVSDGAITVVAAGGTAPFIYSLNGAAGQPTGVFAGLSAGEYGVLITDANACSYTVSFDIDEPTPLVLSLADQNNIICYGSSTGSVIVVASGGTTGYTYSIFDQPVGGTDASISGNVISKLEAGAYKIRVTDNNGCFADLDVSITEPVALTASTTKLADVLCYGEATGVATVTVADGTAPYTYLWSNGSTDKTANGLGAGVYNVTVTDANGCSVTEPVTINEPAAAISVNAGGDADFCSSSLTYTLSGLAANHVSVLWTSTGSGSFDDATALNAIYTPSAADITSGQVKLTLTANGAGSCTSSDQMIITIWKETLVFAGVDATIRMGEVYQVLDAQAENYASILWTHNGAGTLANDKSLTPTYVPGIGETGAVLLTLTVQGKGNCSNVVDQMIINISNNQAPVAINDTDVTNEDTPVVIRVLSNDSDSDGTLDYSSLKVVAGGDPSNGTLSVNTITGEITYTPNKDFHGNDQFIYEICDNDGDCATAVVDITVRSVNDKLVAKDDTADTDEDTPVVIPVTGNDDDSDGSIDKSSLIVIAQPSNGILTVNPITGEITYTPNKDFHGDDTFIYQVCDDEGACDIARVSITVKDVNDAPIALDDKAVTDEDVPVVIDVLSNDSDVDGSLDLTKLTIVVGQEPANGTLVINPATGEITYTPNADYHGPDQFTYEICDDDGDCDTAVVYLTVNSVNDKLVAKDDSATTPEDTPVKVNVLGNDEDSDGTIDISSLVIVNQPTKGSVLIDPLTGEITYTPGADFHGTDTFIYRVCDNEGGCDTATVTITVDDVNDAPVALDNNAITNEDTPVVIDVVANDSDADGSLDLTKLSIVVGEEPDYGTVSINTTSGEITYTPNADYHGNDQFSYEICDEDGDCDTAVVNIIVRSENDNMLANDDTAETEEDTPVVISVLNNDVDPDGSIDKSTLIIVAQPSNGSVSVDPISGKITYTPNPNFHGNDVFIYQVCDDEGGCDFARVAVKVKDVNDAPVALDNNAVTNEDVPVVIDVASNDFDLDGSLDLTTIKIVVGEEPQNGSVSINPTTGEIIYMPNADFVGTDSFVYEICDEDGDCDTASVFVKVVGVNDQMSAMDDSDSTDEDQPVTTPVLNNDTDIDGKVEPSSLSIYRTPSHGTVIVNNDGTITYTPELGFHGVDTYEYQVCDNQGACDLATVNITVSSIDDDAPYAVDDAYHTPEDVAIYMDILSNDNDLDNDLDPTTVSIVAGPANGTVSIDPVNGQLYYTPNPNYNGKDELLYKVCDLRGNCATAKVSITINEQADLPVANDDEVTTPENVAIQIEVLANDWDVDDNIDLATLKIVNQPLNGRLNIDSATGIITYTPDDGYNGLDLFSYEICDKNNHCDQATVSVVVTPVNDPPVATDDFITTVDNMETTIRVLLNDDDPDGDDLTVSIIENPLHGTLNVESDGSITYKANLGYYCNTDMFVYSICDPYALCDTAEVMITIDPSDSDQDMIPDAIEGLWIDQDADGIPNFMDTDSDNDGISDKDEAQITDSCSDLPIDTDGDGIPDYLDIDSDNDGYPDEEEGDDDCDDDGIADYIDSYDDCSEYVSIPEGFSPNGDGVNEFFVIKGIKDFPNSKLMIFNRWGSIIYEAKGYQNDWDARAQNSMTVGTEIVPEGTYYYIIDLGNGSKPIKGFVYINY